MENVLGKDDCSSYRQSTPLDGARSRSPDATIGRLRGSSLGALLSRLLTRTGGREIALDLENPVDSEKRQAIARLREHYGEARKLVPPARLNANLEWILTAARSPEQDAVNLDNKMIGLVEMWLQDLAIEVDRPPRPGSVGEDEQGGPMDDPARHSVAQGLREATETFVIVSRNRAGKRTGRISREAAASRSFVSAWANRQGG